MDSMDQKEVKKSTRRSKKVKNLEEEVELIFSQDESDEDVKEKLEEMLPKTPSRRDRSKNTAATPKAAVLLENLQTPRRSCRKSIRPTQEYDDIVNKSLRSRSAKRHLLATEEEAVEENVENQEEEIIPKWTPAKVGRVSQKRSRKSRRNDKGKNKEAEKTEKQDDETVGHGKKKKKEVKVHEVENEECEEDCPEVAKVSEEVEQDEINKNQKEFEDQEVKETNYKEDTEDVKDSAEQVSMGDIKEEEINEQPKECLEEDITAKKELETILDMEIINEESKHMEPNKEHPEQVTVEQTEKIVLDRSDQIEQNEYNEIDNNDIDNYEESLQLIQEDSEDCKEYEQRAENEEICIVFENNISNNEVEEDKEEDTFGSYLKQKKINISDLGLNLLKDEEEQREIIYIDEQIKPIEDVEDMPSLIVCDDEDDNDEKDCKSSRKLNETFEATDTTETTDVVEVDINTNKNAESIETEKEIENNIESSENPNEEIMETLQMSDDDDGETPRKPPRVQKFTPLKQQMIASALKDSALKINPKDIVLRGIRKRSLSVCINGNEQTNSQKLLAGPLAKAKNERIVSFYSPANQHTIIEDLDKMIAKSLKKQKLIENKDISNKFVTTRRKRSISLDESAISSSRFSKLPRPILNQNLSGKTQTSTSTSKPLSRTKLPNFAAIHDKQFKKMENLVDHVSRKQERSKNLINSATKLKPVSAQKNISIIKNNNNIANEKPKALKKIDLGVNITTQIKKSQLNTTTTKTDLNKTQEMKVINLPDPRLAGINKVTKSGTISRRPPQQQMSIQNYLKPSQTSNIEKARATTKAVPTKNTFNLSTSLMMKPTTSSSLSFAEKAKVTKPTFNLSTSLMVKPTTSSTSFKEKANASYMSNEDKMASRLQRHMDLFKGRVPSTRAGVASRRNETILKGVRSNRRFELQMQHRKNLE